MKIIIKKILTSVLLGYLTLSLMACAHQQKTLSHMKLRENIDEFQNLMTKLPHKSELTGIIYGDAHIENFLWLKNPDLIFPNDFDSVKNAVLTSDFYRLLLSTHLIFNLETHQPLSIEKLKNAYLQGLSDLTQSFQAPTELPFNKNPNKKQEKFLSKKEFERNLTDDEVNGLKAIIMNKYSDFLLIEHYLRVKKTGGSKGKKRYQLWLENKTQNKFVWLELKEQEAKDPFIQKKINEYFTHSYFDRNQTYLNFNQSIYLLREIDQFDKKSVMDFELSDLKENPNLVEKEFYALGVFQKAMNSDETIKALIKEIAQLKLNDIETNINFLKQHL